MQLKLFIVPVKNVSAAEAEMNAFLRANRVLAVKKEFVPDGENSFWTFCVEFMDSPGPMLGGKPPKVDYRELLKPAEFEVFRNNNIGFRSAPPPDQSRRQTKALK